jgi:hypothetical protein
VEGRGSGLSIGGACIEDEVVVTSYRNTLDDFDLQGQRGEAVERRRLRVFVTTVQG